MENATSTLGNLLSTASVFVFWTARLARYAAERLNRETLVSRVILSWAVASRGGATADRFFRENLRTFYEEVGSSLSPALSLPALAEGKKVPRN